MLHVMQPRHMSGVSLPMVPLRLGFCPVQLLLVCLSRPWPSIVLVAAQQQRLPRS